MTTRLILLVLFTPLFGIAQQGDTTIRLTDSAAFAKVEKESAYPGGEAGWQKYLVSNKKQPFVFRIDTR